MPLSLDPEITQALAPMAEAGFTPPLVGDIAGRRAPEHPFPTPIEDAYAALRWLHEHAETWASIPTGSA